MTLKTRLKQIWHEGCGDLLKNVLMKVTFMYSVGKNQALLQVRNRKNENRSVSGITPLLRKETGTKVDILIKYLDDDFGVGEAGLSGGSTSTKYVSEAGIKLPKTMKDVFWNLLKTSNDSAQKICIPGFIINGTELTVKLIDIPSGNACRLYTLGPMAFPSTAATFYKYFIPLVTIVWQ
ncbi:hypothetical protein INT45_014151, partial [Circinella minor]